MVQEMLGECTCIYCIIYSIILPKEVGMQLEEKTEKSTCRDFSTLLFAPETFGGIYVNIRKNIQLQ